MLFPLKWAPFRFSHIEHRVNPEINSRRRTKLNVRACQVAVRFLNLPARAHDLPFGHLELHTNGK